MFDDSRPRLPVGALILCSLLGPFVSSALADTPLNDVQAAAGQWARLRSETSRLEKEWDAEKELLRASITGLGVQTDQIAAEHHTLTAQTTAGRTEIEELTAANLATARSITEAGERIDALARKLLTLRPALPPRLSAALEMPFRSLASTDLPAAERMRHTMSILNRCNQFNQSFVLSEEILPVTPGGDPRLLEVIYWGLAQGCALDRSGNEAFIGRAINGVWTWEPQPDLTTEIADLIDIHQDKSAPVFVTIPAQITGGAQ